MTKTSQSRRPSHTVYMVEGEGDDAIWTPIGALWPHRDGKGFNVSLKVIPLAGRLSIRERTANTDAEESAGA